MKPITILTILLTSVALAGDVLPLASEQYELTLSQEAKHPSVDFPDDAIPDKDYQATKEIGIVHLQFSEDRKQVKILPRGIKGELATADGKKRVYRLSKGLSAGGQLIIESKAKGVTATLTEYGSGVPVISSVRGELKPEIPKVSEADEAHAHAADSAVDPYAKIDGKIRHGMELKEVSGHSKTEILEFWDAFVESHKVAQYDELPIEQIDRGATSYPLDLRNRKAFIHIEGHRLPLVIKGDHYIFTTGDIVHQQNDKDNFTLEVYVLKHTASGFTPTPMDLAGALKNIKP